MNKEQKKLQELNIQTEPQMAIDIFDMARKLHAIYEIESKSVGWETQKDCQVPFDKLPEKNKKVMLRTCARLITYFDTLFKRGD